MNGYDRLMVVVGGNHEKHSLEQLKLFAIQLVGLTESRAFLELASMTQSKLEQAAYNWYSERPCYGGEQFLIINCVLFVQMESGSLVRVAQ